MEGKQGKTVKYEYFRQGGRWQDIAKQVCTWANTNINLVRLISLTCVFCHYDNKNMVNLYYNDGPVPADILAQTSNQVLAYEIFTQERTMLHSWRVHNEKMLEKMAEIAQRGEVVSVCSLENGKEHNLNVTVVWYKRMR